MTSKNLPYYIGFSHHLGIGPMKFAALLNHFGNPKDSYTAPQDKLREIIGEDAARKFVDFRDGFDSEKKLDEIQKKGIVIITQEDLLYPDRLRHIPDPPICLYIKGHVDALKKFSDGKTLAIGIVGTRKPTSYGQQIARTFARDLASVGGVIVSGMALGIDTLAHQGVLSVGGMTIAILGCGVDIIYPPVNKKLYADIQKDGCIISEFPPGQTVHPGLFVARNRLISALSQGVVIVEGTDKSGALITARYAAQQGRDVFAPPAPITSVQSAAPNILLKEGATLVTSAADILSEYNINIVSRQKARALDGLDAEAKAIVDTLASEPCLADDLADTLGVSVSHLANKLSLLEIEGVIEKNQDGKFQLK